jgi:hypothetical protein
LGLARDDLEYRKAGACVDHRAEMEAAPVLRPVGSIDEVVTIEAAKELAQRAVK